MPPARSGTGCATTRVADAPPVGSRLVELILQADLPPLHPALEPMSFLVGTWRGEGVGGYPGMEDFPYEHELTWSHDGRPFLAYQARSWLLDAQGQRLRPAASEVGWWRPGPSDLSVEVMLAHPTGIVEVYLGNVFARRVEVVTEVVARTETARPVTAFTRLYGMVEDDLLYAIDMATPDTPLSPHLSARLARV